MSENDRDPLVDEETAAAAAEARAIGGVAGDEDLDPAERAVREAGGGESEGFEQAEDALVDHASHGDLHSARVPLYDAGKVEEEPSTAVDGEPDELESTEVVEDQDEEDLDGHR
jgi:hypothetical protein